ncbi:MAG: hypothetical protein ACI9Y1_002283 [Lentisphaeria bacterium]|jgi:uncharacterized protein (DUF2132 family)
MNSEIDYKNNPLHGLSLKNMLTELVDHYGFTILFAYLNVNCFKTNPSIDSSVKFLKKTDWAREKVEAFYLYEFKNLPRASAEQFELAPRDRIVPEDQTPSEPAELSLEDAARLQEKREKKAAARGQNPGHSYGKDSSGKNSSGKNSSGKPFDSQRSGTYSKQRNNDDSRKNETKSSHTQIGKKDDPYAKWR